MMGTPHMVDHYINLYPALNSYQKSEEKQLSDSTPVKSLTTTPIYIQTTQDNIKITKNTLRYCVYSRGTAVKLFNTALSYVHE